MLPVVFVFVSLSMGKSFFRPMDFCDHWEKNKKIGSPEFSSYDTSMSQACEILSLPFFFLSHDATVPRILPTAAVYMEPLLMDNQSM